MRALKPQEIMARIAVATPESPIAIFRNPDATYDARFAGPLLTHLDIIRQPHNLVGVYHSGDNQKEILAKMGYTKPDRKRQNAQAARKGYDRKRCGTDVPMIGDMA